MEQELASIIKLVLDSAGNPNPYYEHIPEHFTVPSAYFPRPDVIGGGDTLCTYRLDYTWHIVFRAATQEDAFDMAFQALVEIMRRNNKVPLIDETGQETQRVVRIGKGIRANGLDQCRAQLTISWTSRRLFRKAAQIASLEKVQRFIREWVNDPDIYLTRTVDSAVERGDSSQYDIDLITASNEDDNRSGVKPEATAIAATALIAAETSPSAKDAVVDHDISGTKPDQVLIGEVRTTETAIREDDTTSSIDHPQSSEDTENLAGLEPEEAAIGIVSHVETKAGTTSEDVRSDHQGASESAGNESGQKPTPVTIGSHSVSEATSGHTEVTAQVQPIPCGTAQAHQ